MEHAIYIRDLNDLELFDQNTFNRLYFGNEFCERLIPDKNEINIVLEFTTRKKIPLTFVSPYCTDYGIENLEKIFKVLPRETEVVFNDWGVLSLIQKYNLVPILGRLLVSTKRDPRVNFDKSHSQYLRHSNLNSENFQDFLISNNISCVELDNVMQGYSFNLSNKIKSSLYYPFIYITTSRKCVYANSSKDKLTIKPGGSCFYECVTNTAVSKLQKSDKKLILKGNSQFYKNMKRPKDLGSLNVKRLVFMPSLPFKKNLIRGSKNTSSDRIRGNALNIMAIHTGVHDSSISLIANNKVYAIELERLTRIKHNSNQNILTKAYLNSSYDVTSKILKPIKSKDMLNAINYVLESAKISISDIDLMLSTPCNHHKNHAASAFYPSEFESAAVLVVDNFGEFDKDENFTETVSFWIGTNKRLKNIKTYYSPFLPKNKVLEKYKYHNSIGLFYTDVTVMCDFGVLEGGKTMGLSAYGTDKYLFDLKKFLTKDDSGKHIFDVNYKSFILKQMNKAEDKFKFKADIAYAAQAILEEVIIEYCNDLYNVTKSKNICLAGGIMLNSVVNGKILEKTPFENIFIQPASNDGGISLGKALNMFYSIYDNKLDYNNFYLGKSYSSDDVIKAIEENRFSEIIDFIKFDDLNELCKKTASLIFDNKIIGWFQDKCEYGPRALGNRSILANPLNKGMKDILNSKIKFREWFRPFAPVVLEDDVSKYFKLKYKSPYMLIVSDVINKNMPAVTHIDNSARIQTLNKDQNPILFNLISRFNDLSGIPILLNTSFNLRGQPIVESPDDAIKTFINSELDYLICNNILISKKPSISNSHKKQKINWGSFYKNHPNDAFWGVDIPDDHMIDFITHYNFSKGLKILDSGCGHGKNSKYLIEKGYIVKGIDISEYAISYCKKNIKNGEFYVQDVLKIFFDNDCFNVIVDAGCLHVNDPSNYKLIIKKYYELLQYDGKLFVRIFRNTNNNRLTVPLFFVDGLPVYGLSKKDIYDLFEESNFIVDKLIFQDEDYGPEGVFFVYLSKK